ncbi:hypothetical protein, partial [Glutamicibacter ardleyensis]|uniref:hypothetical protein n=1 Tax=Glutamicibacter ardleyensis TaxID=225894 RepID=UPI003F910320
YFAGHEQVFRSVRARYLTPRDSHLAGRNYPKMSMPELVAPKNGSPVHHISTTLADIKTSGYGTSSRRADAFTTETKTTDAKKSSVSVG